MRIGLPLLGLALSLPPLLSAAEPPRLAVVISVDQLRYDHLDRFAPYFGNGGFKRLRTEGLDFRDAHYRHGVTKTAPGHSLIATGVHANVSGIVANEWVDRKTWQVIASVEDPTSPIVSSEPQAGRSPGGIIEAKAGRSPRNSAAVTLGDQLKLRYGETSRVIAVANKDRSAILMGGKLSDGTYWVDDGGFVTSTFFRASLPDWVKAFNAEKRIEADFGKTWDRLLKPEAYVALGRDDAPGETPMVFGLASTFPKKLNGGHAQISPDYYEAFTHTPNYSVLLAEFAKKAIVAEELGKHPSPDMLWVGFSQIDHVGHLWGPDSHEIMDSLIMLDRVLADFLAYLDRQVGQGRYTVVLTADHGIAPLPERITGLNRDIPAGRINLKALDEVIVGALDAAYGKQADPLRWVMRDNSGYHLLPEALKAKGTDVTAARALIKKTLLSRMEIAKVYTHEDFATVQPLDPIGEAMRLSYHLERSPDVVFVTKPYFFDRTAGVTHGTPYNYDTHVPLLWFGAGVPAGTRVDPVGVDDLVPTLGNLLGIGAPPNARGNVLF